MAETSGRKRGALFKNTSGPEIHPEPSVQGTVSKAKIGFGEEFVDRGSAEAYLMPRAACSQTSNSSRS